MLNFRVGCESDPHLVRRVFGLRDASASPLAPGTSSRRWRTPENEKSVRAESAICTPDGYDDPADNCGCSECRWNPRENLPKDIPGRSV